MREEGCRNAICGVRGKRLSLYDPANVMKGNYKHMAMVETIPWRGPAMGERVTRVANERED